MLHGAARVVDEHRLDLTPPPFGVSGPRRDARIVSGLPGGGRIVSSSRGHGIGIAVTLPRSGAYVAMPLLGRDVRTAMRLLGLGRAAGRLLRGYPCLTVRLLRLGAGITVRLRTGARVAVRLLGRVVRVPVRGVRTGARFLGFRLRHCGARIPDVHPFLDHHHVFGRDAVL